MALTQEQFDALTPDAKVVLEADLDHPFKKVDDNWFLSTSGTRVRVRHFSGAIATGKVALYDEAAPRRWQVTRGGVFYTVALAPNEGNDANWDGFTFNVAAPDTMHMKGITRDMLHQQRGTEIIDADEAPWQEFFKALATHVETEQNKSEAEVKQIREDIEAVLAENRRLAEALAQANAFRTALGEFLGAEVVEPEALTLGRVHAETGLKVGDWITTAEAHALPVGSIVTFRDRDTSTWVKVTDVRWQDRAGGATSDAMADLGNRLIHIGNGDPTDVGTKWSEIQFDGAPAHADRHRAARERRDRIADDLF